jgi:hypothetical protein
MAEKFFNNSKKTRFLKASAALIYCNFNADPLATALCSSTFIYVQLFMTYEIQDLIFLSVLLYIFFSFRSVAWCYKTARHSSF